MIIINPIIIPQTHTSFSSPQNPAQLDPSPPLTSQLPPLFLWKKAKSAFKKYRERKEKKQNLLSIQRDNSQNLILISSSSFFRLATLTQKQRQQQKSLPDGILSSIANLYFDPNEAPLYKDPLNTREFDDLGGKSQEIIQPKYGKNNIDINCQVNSKERMIETFLVKNWEEKEVEYISKVRDDDPFIIIRKCSQKIKKTKALKKEIHHLNKSIMILDKTQAAARAESFIQKSILQDPINSVNHKDEPWRDENIKSSKRIEESQEELMEVEVEKGCGKSMKGIECE